MCIPFASNLRTKYITTAIYVIRYIPVKSYVYRTRIKAMQILYSVCLRIKFVCLDGY
jgi:hypothetical protein